MSYTPLPALGQTTKSGSLPVTVASDQDVLATSAKQDTIIGHVDGIETVLGTIDADTSNISTKIDTLAGAVAGTEMQVDVLTMPTVTVTATNLDVQSGGADLATSTQAGAIQTAVELIDDTVRVLGTDTYTEATSKGLVIGAVRRDADTTLANTTNEFTPLQVDANGYLKVEIFDGGGSHTVDNNGTFAVQSTNQANSGVDIGDVTINNASGASAVNIQDGGNIITVDGTVAATQSGTWTVQPGNTANTTAWLVSDVGVTSGGLSKFHLVSAANTNATSVKASAGQVYAITAFNLNASPMYLKFHNTAGTPTAGSGVTDTFLIPGNTSGAGLVINFDKGITFSTGIGITLVTGITDASAVAVAASEIVLQVYYK
jgi:hypothetical protein